MSKNMSKESTEVKADKATKLDILKMKLHICIEQFSEQKSAKGRMDSLEALKAILSQMCLVDVISEKALEISKHVERSLRKGNADEQCVAVICSSLVIVQLGESEEKTEVFKLYYYALKTVLTEASASCTARAMCATALGLCTFLATTDEQTIEDAMTALEDVFKSAYDTLTSNCTMDAYSSMVNSAMAAWTLLLTVAPESFVQRFKTNLRNLVSVLSSPNMELRITAGQAIALIYEKAREIDEDFEDGGFDELCQTLKSLAESGRKNESKKDQCEQKSCFKAIILVSVESRQFDKSDIQFHRNEVVYIHSWVHQIRYKALCRFLGSSMNSHLQKNELVRRNLSLGGALVKKSSSLGECKPAKHEKRLYGDDTSKQRTKDRQCNRDLKYGEDW